ncbi:hypothetical protein BH11MYX1_BH11MYX1_20290 [soil metagenome]
MPIPGVQAQARLGRYELLARLATGGMGEIFLARLEGAAGFEKLYVIKRILPHLADDARFRQMLISEAQIAAKMAHGNICQVYELGETGGVLYIVMEYLEGVTMLPLLRRASKAQAHLDFGFLAAVVQQTCDALHYAHELKDRDGESLGLVHRDVTPSNIFLCDSGVSKILDFGIAKAKGATSTKTEDGAVKGKYAYMAPEQLRGGAIDRRVDLFALGVVMYEMVALRRLFQRKTDYLTFRAVMEQPIPDIRRYRPDIPDPVANVLAKALDREPANRFETARQLGSAMADAMSASHLRPWSQGDIGDFVKAGFAEELTKRSQQVATAVHRTNPGAVGRSTMPLIAHEDSFSQQADDSEDDEFPSVETDVDSAPHFVSVETERPPTDPFGQSTPPPFSSESTGSAVQLRPLQGTMAVPPPSANAPPIVVVAPRSMLWPILAIVMIGIAGAALYLVWQQTQNQVQPGAVTVISSGPATPDRPPVIEPAVEPDAGAPATAGSGGSGSVKLPGDRPVIKHQRPPMNFDEAVAASKDSLTRCLNDHGRDVTEMMVAYLTIEPNGHPSSVSIAPDNLNMAPVGACLRNVLSVTLFPKGSKQQSVHFTLKAAARG